MPSKGGTQYSVDIYEIMSCARQRGSQDDDARSEQTRHGIPNARSSIRLNSDTSLTLTGTVPFVTIMVVRRWKPSTHHIYKRKLYQPLSY